MAWVLVVESDTDTRERFSLTLRASGFGVTTCASLDEAIRFVADSPNAVVTEMQLPDGTALALFDSCRTLVPRPVFVLTAQKASVSFVMAAIRRGVDEILEKPVDNHELVNTVETLLGRLCERSGAVKRPAAIRWAGVVAKVLDSEDDPRTIDQWARRVAVARGTLKGWCSSVGVTTRRSLLLGRLLRIVVRWPHMAPDLMLDVVDRRTLRRILLAAGATRTARAYQLPPTVQEFLLRQSLVADSELLDVLVVELRRLGHL